MKNDTAEVASSEIPINEGSSQRTDMAKTVVDGVEIMEKTPTAMPHGVVNVIAQYPELKKELLKQFKNNPAIGKYELETKAIDLVSAKQKKLRENKRGASKSQILARDADYLDAVCQVAPLIAASSRETKMELNADQLTIRFPFPPSSAHLQNALRDLKPKLRKAVDAVLVANGQLLISVFETNKEEK